MSAAQWSAAASRTSASSRKRRATCRHSAIFTSTGSQTRPGITPPLPQVASPTPHSSQRLFLSVQAKSERPVKPSCQDPRALQSRRVSQATCSRRASFLHGPMSIGTSHPGALWGPYGDHVTGIRHASSEL